MPLVAVYTTVTRSHSAIVVDLSNTGVRLRGSNFPGKGEEVLVSIEHIRAFGTVAWTRNRQCGIAFDLPLDKGAIATIRQAAVRSAEYKPEVKAALDDWTVGLAR